MSGARPSTYASIQVLAPTSTARAVLLAFDDEPALHFLGAALVDRQIAVDLEFAWPVGAKLERHRLARLGALADAVRIDREAVGNVFRGKGDADEIVLLDADVAAALSAVAVLAPADGNVATILRDQDDRAFDGKGQR